MVKKILEATALKEFASTFFNDPILKMAVNAVVDNAPGIELVHCKDCKHWSYTSETQGDCRNPRFAMPDTVDPTMYAHEFCALGEREEK